MLIPMDTESPRMPSVALIVLDTVRKDAFESFFEWLPGKRFDRAYSTSHWTVPVHASLFGGKYSSELNVRNGAEALDCPEPTLAEVLSTDGVTTRAFSANPYISEHFGFDRGFEDFRHPWQLDSIEDEIFDWRSHVDDSRLDPPLSYLTGIFRCLAGDERSIPSLLYAAKLFFARRNEFGLHDDGASECASFVRDTEFGDDEFLFCNLMEAHAPYHPPDGYQTADIDRLETPIEMIFSDVNHDAETVRRAYDESVRYLSDKYREIFDELSSAFDYVITCSDHGELFGREGLWGHATGVYPELTHVPLVISGDDVSDDHCESVVSLLDVHRTIADLFDVEVDSRGHTLLGDVTGNEYLTEAHGSKSSILDGRTVEPDDRLGKLLLSPRTGIAAPTDYYGYETVDEFVETGTADVDDPHGRMIELRKSLDDAEKGADDHKVSEKVQAKLADLGYL